MKVYEDLFNGYKEIVEQVTAAGVVTTYHGQAEKGTATSAPKWRIKKIVETTVTNTVTTVITYAGGSGTSFSYAWDDRATLTYA